MKGSSPHPFHAQTGPLTVLLQKKHLHYPRMINQGGKGRLVAEMHKLLLVSGMFALKHLEGYLFT